MKEHIISQVKGVGFFIIRDIPTGCQGRHDVQIAVNLHQGVVQLVYRPHNGLVLGKSGVNGGNSSLFIVMKEILLPLFTAVAGSQYSGNY